MQRLDDRFVSREPFPTVYDFCQPEFHELEAIGSSNMGFNHWERVTEHVRGERSDFDG